MKESCPSRLSAVQDLQDHCHFPPISQRNGVLERAASLWFYSLMLAWIYSPTGQWALGLLRSIRAQLSPSPVSSVACLALLLSQGALEPSITAADVPTLRTEDHPFRLAVTSSMFSQVKETDARAAMKAWITTVAKERNIPVDPDPLICRTLEELERICQTNGVDGIGLQVPEYAQLNLAVRFDRFAVAVNGGSITEEYVLLARADRRLERLEQLEGQSLNVLNTPRMSLALIWLDTRLLEAGKQPSAKFFKRMTMMNNANRVALPVFFGKIDACLITRRSFKVMGELNPQLEKQLCTVAVSPELVPSGFAFRLDNTSPVRTKLLDEMTRLNETPAGQQILTLTQAERIEDRPVSCLNSALELLATHARLRQATNTAAALGVETPVTGAIQQ